MILNENWFSWIMAGGTRKEKEEEVLSYQCLYRSYVRYSGFLQNVVVDHIKRLTRIFFRDTIYLLTNRQTALHGLRIILSGRITLLHAAIQGPSISNWLG
jgi:hypothetical protein